VFFDSTFLRFPLTARRSAVVSALAAALLTTPIATPQTHAQTTVPPGFAQFKQALAATQAGKFAQAEKLYRQLLKINPNVPAAWANLGILCAQRGNFAEAIRCAEKATKLEPTNGAFWGQLSSHQLRSGNILAAEKSARKAVGLSPKDLIAAANLADSLIAQRRYEEAIPVLQKMRTLEAGKPNDRAEISLVMTLNSLNRINEGLVVARKRVARLPKDPNAYLLLGDTARLAGQLLEAEKAYQQAVSLDPKNRNAQLGLSFVATLKGDRAGAAKILNKLVQQSPDDARLHFQLGYLYYSDPRMDPQQRFTTAEKSFGKAVVLEPKNPMYITYQGLAVMLQGQNRFDVADKLFRSALVLEPRFTMARMGLAYLAERQNNFDLAAAQYKGILEYAPGDREARRGLAGAYYAAKKKPDAYREMQAIADANPKEVVILAELGSWQSFDSAWDEAQKTYTTLLQRDPKNVPAMLALGNVYEKKKQSADARKYYEMALAADPKNGQATLMLGNLLTETDRLDEAVGIYRRYLEQDSGNNTVRWQLAQTLQTQKRYDEALKELRSLTLVKDDPNRLAFMVAAPRLLMEQKQYDEAITELKRLERENPREDAIRIVMSEAYEKSGKFADAERILKEMADRPREQPADMVAAVTGLAALYERAEKWEEAATNYEDALRFQLQAAEPLAGLKRVRAKQNKPEAVTDFVEKLAFTENNIPNGPAISFVYRLHQENKTMDRYRDFTKRLVEKYPESHVALIVRARAILEPGNPTPEIRQEAFTLAKKMAAQNPSDKDAQTILAEQSEALGKKEDAIGAYKMLLRINPRDEQAAASLRRHGVDPNTVLNPQPVTPPKPAPNTPPAPKKP
jgi:superkiller protein 3